MEKFTNKREFEKGGTSQVDFDYKRLENFIEREKSNPSNPEKFRDIEDWFKDIKRGIKGHIEHTRERFKEERIIRLEFQREVVLSCLYNNQINIKKTKRVESMPDLYPRDAVRAYNSITDEDIKKALIKQKDLVSLAPLETGTEQGVWVKIKEDQAKKFEIIALVSLRIGIDASGPEIEVEVLLHNSKPSEYDEHGNCVSCNGVGCWDCNFSN